jgi:ADP-ribose 1''-phosphate phosphatase
VEFKKRFPQSFEAYRLGCLDEDATGFGMVLPSENGYHVGILITSTDFGLKKDSPEKILKSTKAALECFFESLPLEPTPIFSNKFNSGLFQVPWEETEKVLASLIGEREWTVCEI